MTPIMAFTSKYKIGLTELNYGILLINGECWYKYTFSKEYIYNTYWDDYNLKPYTSKLMIEI